MMNEFGNVRMSGVATAASDAGGVTREISRMTQLQEELILCTTELIDAITPFSRPEPDMPRAKATERPCPGSAVGLALEKYGDVLADTIYRIREARRKLDF